MSSIGEVTIKTRFNADMIEQEIRLGDPEGQRAAFVRYIADLRERELRNALIALGWTPPGGQF